MIQGDDRVEYLKNYRSSAKRGITMPKPSDSDAARPAHAVAAVARELTSESHTR